LRAVADILGLAVNSEDDEQVVGAEQELEALAILATEGVLNPKEIQTLRTVFGSRLGVVFEGCLGDNSIGQDGIGRDELE